MARSNLTDDGKLVYRKPEVAAVEQKVVQVAAQQRLGLFKPERENDQLTAALGTPKHTGRVCVVASQMPWKHGFPKDGSSYKRHDRYKKTMEETIEEKLNTMFEDKIMSWVQSLNQEGQLDFLQPEQREYMTQNRPRHVMGPPTMNLSSVASTSPALGTPYPVDDITVDTPCRLHVPLGRVGNRTKEVAIGVAMPGRVFHNNPIPPEYAKVSVTQITDMGYIDYPLDHVTPEGVKELGEAVNQFILWNRRKIFLDGLVSP